MIALAIAGVASAQEAPAAEQNAAPEPYSYAYETDSHAASEQRDPSGKVTGFYTLVDADGRSRRVEYIADETGFHAKVATNEVGTKSENPADVVIEAAPPTEAQYSYVSTVQAQPQPIIKQQVVATQAPRVAVVQQQPARVGYTVVQQPSTIGYNAQYGYYPGSAYTYGQGYGQGYGNIAYGTAGYGLGVGNYNNHLPSQYYRSVGTTYAPGAAYTVGGIQQAGGVRYVSQPATVGAYRTSGYQTVGVPGAVSYSSGSIPATTRTIGSASGLSGSSNYIVLKKAK